MSSRYDVPNAGVKGDGAAVRSKRLHLHAITGRFAACRLSHGRFLESVLACKPDIDAVGRVLAAIKAVVPMC